LNTGIAQSIQGLGYRLDDGGVRCSIFGESKRIFCSLKVQNYFGLPAASYSVGTGWPNKATEA